MELYKIFAGESKDGYFTETQTNLASHNIWELSKRKLSKDKFRSKVDFPVNYDSIASALESGAKAYYYISKGKVAAIYVIRKDTALVSCNDIYFTSELPKETKDSMDHQIAFLVAKEAKNNNIPSAVFNGEELPKLQSKPYFNWGLFLSLGLGIAVCWYLCFDEPIYAVFALLIGFGCGFSTKYKFEGSQDSEVASETQV